MTALKKVMTSDDVSKLAALSALQLTTEEATALRDELADILGYVEQLDTVDTTGIEPTYQVTGLSNITRADELIDYNVTQDELLMNAPMGSEDGQLKVRKVL